MKNWYIFPFLILIVIVGYTFSNSGDNNDRYAREIAEKRVAKDKFMRESPKSPIEDKANFKGLHYFEPDIRYKVEATIKLIEPSESIEMPTSTGEKAIYIKFAYLNFKILGKKYQLVALRKAMHTPLLFLGFTDETSNKSTYGGGRYLDTVFKNGQKTLTLDFNLAYHPYCAYSLGYACPIPLKENALALALEVGEKN